MFVVGLEGLIILSAFTMGILAIYLTENFGDLANQKSLVLESDHDRLGGPYANGLLVMSGFVIAFCGLSFFLKGGNLSIYSFITSAALNIHLIIQYGSIPRKDIATDPEVPQFGKNYKLRGSYGTGVLAMGSITVGLSSLSLLASLF